MAFVPLRKAVALLGMHPNTLRQYADAGIIPAFRSPAGQRLFDVDAYLKSVSSTATICYCRVSSAKQRDDLERQCARMRKAFPQAEIIQDIGSGLNFKRKGLRAILERLLRGDKLKIVVAHRDRLCRFGFDLIQFLAESGGGEIVVLDGAVGSPEVELTQDLLAILHHFSCRMHGSRSHQGKKDQAIPDNCAKSDVPEMVRRLQARLQQDCSDAEHSGNGEAEALDGCGAEDDDGNAGTLV